MYAPLTTAQRSTMLEAGYSLAEVEYMVQCDCAEAEVAMYTLRERPLCGSCFEEALITGLE